MVDWTLTALNTNQLIPKNRLDKLFERAKSTHVDDNVHIRRYILIAKEFLNSANAMKHEKKYEDSLFNFLRYQILVKKIKGHVSYKKLNLAKRAAFDYKLREVAKTIAVLTENVLASYTNLYSISNLEIDNYDLDAGYQEQRPTISTIRTFVSTPRHSISSEFTHAPHKPFRARSKSFVSTRISSAVDIPMMKNLSPLNLDPNYGLRRSIFPAKQVKEFDEIHKQRKIVRNLRTVVVPGRITTVFSHLSFRNNKKNVETVAYLAGREISPTKLLVTHLVLPKQRGFSDYFKVTDSGPLIKYLEMEDLLTIGWMHSHPLESPYLSSKDKHFHGIFQNVLPEAIAVVYSPKEMRSQIFNLTPDDGLKVILQCKEEGFHTHSTNLTMDSHHIVTDPSADLIVRDFRMQETSRISVSFEQKGRKRSVESGSLMDRLMHMKIGSGQIKKRRSEVSFASSEDKINYFNS